MSTNKIFLETTIQIERIFGKNREEIFKFLKDKELITSTYVLMEFKRTIIKDCIALYAYLKEEGSLKKTFDRLSRLRPNRSVQRILRILAILSEDCKLEYEKMIERLEDLIESELIEYFFYNISQIIDKTGCWLAKEDVKKIDSAYYLQSSCRRDDVKCRIKEFVIENKEEFEKIYNELNKLNKFIEVSKVIKEVLDDPSKMCGINCNKKLGDCVISVESPRDAIIFTTDHHYSYICNALNKEIKLL